VVEEKVTSPELHDKSFYTVRKVSAFYMYFKESIVELSLTNQSGLSETEQENKLKKPKTQVNTYVTP
jgi:hypothetical protein